MLDNSLLEQVKTLFENLQNDFVLEVIADPKHDSYNELIELLNDTVGVSDHVSLQINNGTGLAFSIRKNDEPTGVSFRGVPNGHEFTSLLLAILNADGQGKNIPAEAVCQRIRNLQGEIKLTTFVSLTCTNCPDVVQILNLMSLLNPNVSHEMVDGAVFQEEAQQLNVQAVPTVFANGELLSVGKTTLGELLDKLEVRFGSKDNSTAATVKQRDIVVIGGGPAGCSAAIYAARKGLKVTIIAQQVGGQVNETTTIENLISVPHTTGKTLALDLKTHLKNWNVEILEHYHAQSLEISGNEKIVTTRNGEKIVAPAVIIATGAKWKQLNVTGEQNYIGKGVAFCPHCDGPLFKGKNVAVIGGGNSGIEAAIDLAGICKHVTVVEFLDQLRADQVLQNKAQTLSNVNILLNTQTIEIVGDTHKVTGIRVKNRTSNAEQTLHVDGVFVQIGLAPNSDPVKNLVATNKAGEIEINNKCRTNVPGVYAAGDVTTVPYKQIIIAMGEGAKAALAAFEDMIKTNG